MALPKRSSENLPQVPSIPVVEQAAGSPPLVLAAAGFREIYDQYFAFVWRLAANRGVPASALEDVAQEVFIVVHRKLPEFEGRSSMRTWLAGIVRRVVADFVRKRGNRPTADHELADELSAGPVERDPIEHRAALAWLDALLAKMSDEQREVFVMHEIEHMSGVEIAAATETNENTVWTRLRAARRIFEQGIVRYRAAHRGEMP